MLVCMHNVVHALANYWRKMSPPPSSQQMDSQTNRETFIEWACQLDLNRIPPPALPFLSTFLSCFHSFPTTPIIHFLLPFFSEHALPLSFYPFILLPFLHPIISSHSLYPCMVRKEWKQDREKDKRNGFERNGSRHAWEEDNGSS